MTMIKKCWLGIPPYIRYLVGNLAVIYLLLLIFRGIFFLFVFRTSVHEPAAVAHALYLGLKFDMRLALLLLLPIALLMVVFRQKLFARPLLRAILLGWFFLADLALVILYTADLGYYAYLGQRLDPAILRFVNLRDAGTNARMVWESYPVIRGALAMALLLFLLFRAQRWLYRHYSIQPAVGWKKGRTILALSLVLLLFAAGIYGNIDYYPLRWSQAMFSRDNGLTSLGLNPVTHFFSKLKFSREGFDTAATRRYYPALARYLGVQDPDPGALRFSRSFAADSSRPRPNIVFVMLESTGAAATSIYGNPLQPTPHMKALADSGVVFEQFYVPAHSTARTVYGFMTGLPDITAVETASRNPDMVRQRVIMDQFEGYEKFYLLGGNMNWANIRAVFTLNVGGVKLFEENDLRSPKADVWGVSDYDLIGEADSIFREAGQSGKPFVAFLQLADNHEPFTTTPGAGDFRPLKAREVDKEKFKASGFMSMEQLNALRYEDYNVGHLIALARRSGYLDHTIFVMFGDHNCTMNPYHFMPLPEYEMGTGAVHATCFIYGPAYFSPRRVSAPASLLDLFPTMARFAGMPFTNYTLGTDLFDSSRTERYAFYHISRNAQTYDGLLGSRFAYEIGRDNGSTALYDLQEDPLRNVLTMHPDTARYLDSLTRGFIESTWYLMHNNQKTGRAAAR